MKTVEIISESQLKEARYRAICGQHQAVGTTPGQALDRIEQELLDREKSEEGGILVILQRFQADDLFTTQQQSHLKSLMAHFHETIAVGESFSKNTEQELEDLVEVEFKAAIERSRRILEQIQPHQQ